MTLCIFLASGRTYTFNIETIEYDNENELCVTYKAASDGRVGRLRVRKPAIVAWSIKEAEDGR